MFAIDGKSVKEVRERLNATGKFDRGGRPWTSSRLLRILNNKIYSGVSIFGKQLNNLGQPKPLPRSQWIISKVMEPIVPDEITRAVSEKFESMRRRNWTKDAVKAGLRRLLRERGYISYPAIEEAAYLPSSSVILRNFGDITELCRTIGYEKPRRACRFHARIYTDDELLTEIIRIHRQQGSITGRAIDEDTKSPSSAYFALRFGGLRNAYLAAGLMASQPGQIPPNRRVKARLFSNDELLKGLGELLAQAGFLSCSLINQEPSLPQAEVFCRRFGTLSKAYELIGYRQSRAEVLRLSKAYQESAEAERRGAALN